MQAIIVGAIVLLALTLFDLLDTALALGVLVGLAYLVGRLVLAF